MKNKKQDEQLEKLLFEVYEKGVKQQDCDLTEYIEKVRQSLHIHDIVERSEQFYCDERDKYGNTECTQQCMACVRDEQVK